MSVDRVTFTSTTYSHHECPDALPLAGDGLAGRVDARRERQVHAPPRRVERLSLRLREEGHNGALDVEVGVPPADQVRGDGL